MWSVLSAACARVPVAIGSLSPGTPKALVVPHLSDDPRRKEQRQERNYCPLPPPNAPSCPEQTELPPSQKSLVGEEGREVNNSFAKLPQKTGWNELAELKGPIWETTQGFQDLTP